MARSEADNLPSLTMDTAPELSASPPAVPSAVLPPLRSAFVAAALGWLLPGLGQLYVGRPGKALLMLVVIGGLFYGGLALTAFTCVHPENYTLEFVAHAFLGGPTALTLHLTHAASLTEPAPWFEVGRLYAAVAGLLNLVAICDALGEVLAHNHNVRLQQHLLRSWFEERQRDLDRRAAALRERHRAEFEAHAAESASEGAPPPAAPPADDLPPLVGEPEEGSPS